MDGMTRTGWDLGWDSEREESALAALGEFLQMCDHVRTLDSGDALDKE